MQAEAGGEEAPGQGAERDDTNTHMRKVLLSPAERLGGDDAVTDGQGGDIAESHRHRLEGVAHEGQGDVRGAGEEENSPGGGDSGQKDRSSPDRSGR